MMEAGGIAGHYSINYERSVSFDSKWGISHGVGFAPSLIDPDLSPRVPIRMKIYRDIDFTTIELGLGVTPYFWLYDKNGSGKKPADFGVGLIGYLGHKKLFHMDKLYWGTAFTPIFYDRIWRFEPWVGVQFGFNL